MATTEAAYCRWFIKLVTGEVLYEAGKPQMMTVAEISDALVETVGPSGRPRRTDFIISVEGAVLVVPALQVLYQGYEVVSPPE